MELYGGEGAYYRSQNIGDSPSAEHRTPSTLLKQYTLYNFTNIALIYIIIIHCLTSDSDPC